MRMSSKLWWSGLKNRSVAISFVAAHVHRVDAFFSEIGNQSARLKRKSKCRTQEQK